METAVLACFRQENLLYIKWHLSENLIHFQSLLKNMTLLPAEKFGNISLYQQTVKIISDFRIEISFMEI